MPENETAPSAAPVTTGAADRVRARIDLAALRANVRALRERAGDAGVMAVVKADAYGHGMVPCARAAREAGAAWLGTATPQEALTLRAAGIGGPVLCWLWTPGGPWREAVEADVDVTVSGMWALREVIGAARAARRPARVQLKADTGLGRNGAPAADWPDLVAAAMAAEADGLLKVTGLWSHFACADEPGHPSIAAQLAEFHSVLAVAEAAGYADGVPRHASGTGPVLVAGKWRTVAGRVAMDQFVVDLGGDTARAGDEAVLFGTGEHGEPTAEDWASACGTIAYEIVTRIGARVPRVYADDAAGTG
jgi:alanine racemase